MADTFSPFKTSCRCSHAKESHYEKQHGCLAARCDCSKYVGVLDTTPNVVTSVKASVESTRDDDGPDYSHYDYDYDRDYDHGY